jgi:hypothetical protein
MNPTHENTPKVLIIAPFSLKENWADRPWPFLEQLQESFGEEHVDFFGLGRTSAADRNTWLKQLKHKCWPIVSSFIRGAFQ